MTEFELGCAVLSSASYREGRNAANQTPAITGAVQLGEHVTGPGGFEAVAYSYNGKIVIAYTGTNPADIWGDEVSDAKLAFGFSDTQLEQAADFYQKIKRLYGSDITFTGHSLGGGLAAVMGVFFNKDAVAFDEAPFRTAATKSVADALQNYLTTATPGHPAIAPDPDLATYTTTEVPLAVAQPQLFVALSAIAAGATLLSPLGVLIGPQLAITLLSRDYPVTVRGESRIKSISVSGEFLTAGIKIGGVLAFLPEWENALRIQSTTAPESIDINPVGVNVAGDQLHSISLLVAAATSARLVADIQAMPFLAEQFFDVIDGIAQLPLSQKTDFLNKLVRFEYGSGAPTGFIEKFAVDLARLTATVGTSSQLAVQKSLALAAIEYYNGALDPTATTSFYDVSGNAINFKLDAINSHSPKSPTALIAAVQGLTGEQSINPSGSVLAGQSAWHVQSGANAMVWSAGSDTDKDAVIGGSAGDFVSAGAGNDVIFGLGGSDTIDGGSGNDILDGGAGGDTYVIGSNSGVDDILSSELADSLNFGGRILVGAGTIEAVAEGVEVWVDRSISGAPVTYVLNANGVLKVSGSGSTVFVEDFQNGDLGIHIPAATPDVPPVSNFAFDFGSVAGRLAYFQFVQSYGNTASPWPNIRIDNAINASTGGALGGAGADIIIGGDLGSSTRTILTGGAGDDRLYANDEAALEDAIADGETDAPNHDGLRLLSGGTGDDELYGGAGDDVIYGGTGSDTLVGGAGNDIILADVDNATLYPAVGSSDAWGIGGNNVAGNHPRWMSLTVRVALIGTTVPRATGESFAIYDYESLAFNPLSEVDFSGLLAMRPEDIHPRTPEEMAVTYVPNTQLTYAQLYGGQAYGHEVGSGNDVVYAGAGDDVVNTGKGDDIVFAGSGNDMVAGYDGDDYIDGGSGDDRLYGDYQASNSSGADQQSTNVFGASYVIKNTLAPALHGRDYIDGGDGNDFIYGGGQQDELYGGKGNDFIYGDDTKTLGIYAGDDYLDGEDGNDTLYGGGGADQLEGGDGDDVLVGDNADDGALYSGKDYLNGGAGADELAGGGNDDELYGGSGNDTLFGDATETDIENVNSYGNDYLAGEDGDDALQGGRGDDTLDGGSGNDVLFGEQGDDALSGGTGNDSLNGNDGTDWLDGGEGDDAMSGGAGADTMMGSSGADYLAGDDGDDSLDGGEGNDTLFGGAGNDTLTGGLGSDYLNAGAGNDTYVFAAGESPIGGLTEAVDDSGGDNVILMAGVDPTSLNVQAAGSTLVIDSSSGDRIAIVNGIGATNNKFAFGTTSALTLNELVGRYSSQAIVTTQANGAALVIGGRNTDVIAVTGGNAQLSGGRGNDRLTATGGNNTYFYQSGDGIDTITDGARVGGTYGAQGASHLVLGNGIQAADIRFSTSDASHLDLIFGSEGADRISIDGFNRANALAGLSIADVNVAGSVVSLSSLLTQGFDIGGTDGNDLQLGTNVVDRFAASAGNDTLDGGTGSDTYNWGTGAGQDVVIDAEIGGTSNDVLRIDASLASADIYFARTGNDIVVKSRVGTDQITLTNQAGGAGVENVSFADGTTVSRAAILTHLTHELTSGADRYFINTTAENIAALAGDDSIYGNLGDDTIDGGLGNDLIYGSSGSDVLFGSDGNDSIFGGLGDDRLDGGAGADSLTGDAGNDVLSGGVGDDNLQGGDGIDVLTGGTGNDLLDGGRGDDRYLFASGFGSDTVDNASAVAGEHDTISFGVGLSFHDIALEWLGDALRLRFQSTGEFVNVTGFFLNPALTTIQFASGESFDRTNAPAYTMVQFAATPGDDVVTLSSGDDYFDALAGNDIVYAGAGNDTVLGSAGYDVLHGQAGNDLLNGGADGDALYGDDGDDTLVGSAYSYYDGDALYGGAGNDSITGGSTVDAGAGDDFIDSPGAQITMGTGNDTVFVRSSTHRIVITDKPGVGEIKTFKFAADITPSMLTFQAYGTTYDVNFSWPAGQLTLTGFRNLPVSQQGYRFEFASTGETLTYNDMRALINRPTQGPDFIEGTAGNDVINGLGGNDEIYGLAGNDRLIGGGGIDYLYGGLGNDTLSGGAVMSGDGGLDTYYVFDTSETFNTRVNAAADGGDVVIVDASLLPQNIHVGAQTFNGSNDIVLQRLDASGLVQSTVTMISQGVSNGTAPPVAEVRFQGDPSTVWSAEDLFRMANTGGERNDSLIGFSGRNNNLIGNGGDDDLIGGALADTLDGGSGSDYLSGGAGADTYVFGRGYGSDRVVDIDGSSTNLLQLKADVNVGAVQLVRTGQDSGGVMRARDSLVLLLPATGEQIWIDQFFLSASAGTLAIRFADGTTWSYSTIAALAGASISGSADTQYGGTGNDIFYVDNALDVIVEGVGGGNDTVRSSVSYTLPNNVENIELTGIVGIDATGNAGENVIKGNSGSNVLDGGYLGNPVDHFAGGAGDDTYRVIDLKGYAACNDPGFFNRSTFTIAENAGEGYDTLVTNEFSAHLPDNVERLVVSGLVSVAGFVGITAEQASLVYTGNALDNVIDLSAIGTQYGFIKRVIDGGAGADTMIGSAYDGDEIFVVDNQGDVVIASGTTNTTVTSSVNYTLGSNLKNLTLSGLGALTGTGNDIDNTIDGASNSNANVLRGLTGNDTYVIGLNDTVLENAGEGRDIVVVKSLDGRALTTVSVDMWQNVEGAGLDNAVGAIGLLGNAADNVLLGNDSSNQLFGLDGNDTLSSLDMSKVAYVYEYGGYQFSATARSSSDVLDGGAGNDVINAYSGFATIRGGSGDDQIKLLLCNAQVDGGSGNDTISGMNSSGRLAAGLGSDHDVLSNSVGANLVLSAGTDASALTFTGDTNALTIGYGNVNDSLRVNDFYSGAIGSIAINGGVLLDYNAVIAAVGQSDLRTGTSGNDLLIAALGGGAIRGGAGNDSLVGQSGDDVLDGGSGSDTYLYAAGFGNDTIDAFDTSASKIDSVRFQSAATDAVLTREGNDLLISVRATGDSIRVRNHFVAGYQIDNLTFGNPLYYGSRSWNAADIQAHLSADHAPVLVAPLTNVTLTRGDALSLVVPAGTFTDPDASDVLTFSARLADGGALPAWLNFDAATQTFSGNSAAATVGVSSVKLIATDSSGVSASAVFNVAVTASNAGPFVLYGSAGDDTITAGAGDDTIYAGAGNDLVVGGIGANVLYGEAGDDRLIGNGGADFLDAGLGNDTYVIDNASQQVIERSGAGTDTIESSIDTVLAANVENLVLTGFANLKGTGNDLANILTGNDGANVLTAGRAGGTLYGGAGNDTLVDGGAGAVVKSSLATAELSTNNMAARYVETQIARKNRLFRTSWSTGDDGEVTADGDALSEPFSDRSADSIRSAVSATATSYVPFAGATMIGGTGDDTYVVNNAADIVIEQTNEGIDTVQSSISFTLAANVENLVLTGNDAINGLGNGLANTITGNDANNSLKAGYRGGTLYGRGGNDILRDGALGPHLSTVAVVHDDAADPASDIEGGVPFSNDAAASEVLSNASAEALASVSVNPPVRVPSALAATLVGGTGDDNYVVNISGDVVVEAAGEGDDTITATVNFVLAANVEHLVLVGSANINGTGNDEAHTLVGNSGDNVLTAGSGGGVLDGNGGNDTLIGGAGNDTFVFGVGRQSHTTIENSDGADVLRFMGGITADQIWMNHAGNNLEVGIAGTGNTAMLVNWFSEPQHQLTQFQLGDGNTLMASQVQGLVQAMATFSAPAATSTSSEVTHLLMNQAILPTVVNNTWGI